MHFVPVEMVEEGIRVLEIYSGTGDPLAPLLRKIWLEQGFKEELQGE